ncbi:MAG: GTPase RsgA [Ruthenibacterium sp.]
MLVITKGDLQDAGALMQCYRTAGFPVLCVNAATGEAGAAVRHAGGKLSVFSGNLGVGKSTLLGADAGPDAGHGEISQKLGRGRPPRAK